MVLRIGIIGFGVVGKSVLRFLTSSYGKEAGFYKADQTLISVWDKRTLSLQERELIASHDARAIDGAATTLEAFFSHNDLLIPSPGIDLRSFKNHSSKIISEIDLFSACWQKNFIGITGSLGKTSITRLVEKLLSLKETVAMGGNIGVGMLDLLAQRTASNVAVLELSSFQLAYARQCAPKVAVLSNIFPNHLDWHTDIDDYFFSKMRITTAQSPSDYFVFSSDVLTALNTRVADMIALIKARPFVLCSQGYQESEKIWALFPHAVIFYENDRWMERACVEDGKVFNERLFPLDALPSWGFGSNWLIALATVYAYVGSLEWLQQLLHNDATLSTKLLRDLKQEHRLEHFATFNGIDFYNDSKASIVQATQAAVDTLAANQRPIILVLGGTGKGVDRRWFFDHMEHHSAIKKVLYLGPEPKQMDRKNVYSSLDELVHAIFSLAQMHDQVLFSPSGASFDLFANYIDRGNQFKKALVQLYNPVA